MFKSSLSFLLIFIISFGLHGQNLVPNPSFELLRNLPIKRLEVFYYEFEARSSNKAFKEHLNYWFSGNKNSPDLRELDQAYIARSKSKYNKHYVAKTGDHAIGLVTYLENKDGNKFREYIEVKLKKGLTKEIETFVEFWVILDRQAKFASNNLGCYFSMKKIKSLGKAPIFLTPQINEDSIILGNRFEWKKISGSFIPNKSYNFITIGNFYSEEATKLKAIKEFRGVPFTDPTAYYLIDDVRVWQEGDVEVPINKFVEKEITVGTVITLENIEFETNSSVLKENAFHELNELLNFMKKTPKVKIGIYGHTDNEGNQVSNLRLSESRSNRIYNYLLENGITKERMVSEGFGETNPIKDNTSEEGRQKNRRVEFIILAN